MAKEHFYEILMHHLPLDYGSLLGIGDGWIWCWQTNMGLDQRTGSFTDLLGDRPFCISKKKKSIKVDNFYAQRIVL